MRKKRRIVALVLTLLFACSMSVQAGFTPRYEIDITDASGTRTKEVTTNYLILTEGEDDFFPGCMDTEDAHPTVRVRAFGEDETYSPWSDVAEISCYK